MSRTRIKAHRNNPCTCASFHDENWDWMMVVEARSASSWRVGLSVFMSQSQGFAKFPNATQTSVARYTALVLYLRFTKTFNTAPEAARETPRLADRRGPVHLTFIPHFNYMLHHLHPPALSPIRWPCYSRTSSIRSV